MESPIIINLSCDSRNFLWQGGNSQNFLGIRKIFCNFNVLLWNIKSWKMGTLFFIQ